MSVACPSGLPACSLSWLQFTRHLFTLEQQEYESEGIDWTKIEFVDNQECVDVIEMAPPKVRSSGACLERGCSRSSMSPWMPEG